MAFRWRADDGPTLNAGWLHVPFFQGIRTNIAMIAKKSFSFVIYQGKVWTPGPPSPPHLDPRIPSSMLFQRPIIPKHGSLISSAAFSMEPLFINNTCSYPQNQGNFC